MVRTSPAVTTAGKARARPPERSSGVPALEASMLVEEAVKQLCQETGLGPKARAHLRWHGLSDGTIEAAMLGFVPTPLVRELRGKPQGIVIPWFDHRRLTLVKIRQPDHRQPKYFELFRDRPILFPSVSVIRPGKPLVIVEGEFDALLMGQELAGLAAVVTLGSASARPSCDIFGAMLTAPVWYIGTDGDDAGDRSASGWPGPSPASRPPVGKDWTDAYRAG